MTHRNRTSERGNAVLEFALSFAVLWALFSGVFQYGYSMYIYNNLAIAVANGANYAARVQFDDPDHTFATAVKNMVVYGSPAAGTTPMVAGLGTGNVAVSWTTDSEGVPQTITVGITGFTVNAVFKTFTFTNKPQVTVKWFGVYKTEE